METEGRPLVLLHGAGQRPPMWQPLVTELGADRALFAPWLPGLKPTDKPAAFDLGAAADTLAGDLELRGMEKIDLCGVSLGGMVALRMAAEHPDRVGKLILISTPVVPSRMQARLQRGLLRFMPERAVAASGVPKRLAMEALAAMASADLSTDLKRVTQPTLVLVGAADQAMIAAGDQLLRGIPQAQLVTISGASNDIVRERPEAVAEAIGEFLD